MSKKAILQKEQIESVRELSSYASCALENLFVGLQDEPTGIQDCEECFTKSDIKSIGKALTVIRRIRENFDGTRKQIHRS